MDPTKELSTIIGDLGVQVAYLQAQIRVLKEENNQLRSVLQTELDDKPA